MDFHTRHARPPSLDSDNERPTYRSSRRKGAGQHGQNVHPNPPLTPNAAPPPTMPQAISNPLLPSAPASPPTPAPSPTPHQRSATWHERYDEIEDPILRDARFVFSSLDMASKEAWLTSLVDMCDNQTLGFLHRLVSPKLKKDPFKVLPDELCLRVGLRLPLPRDRRHTTNHMRPRCSNTWMIRKLSCEPRLSLSAGENLSAMTRHGRLYARNMNIVACPRNP